ncbi:MAG: flagellar hook-length control protein FliK [Oleispira sp.]
METQPTHNGLMQIFTSLGLATESSLAGLEGGKSDGKAFASLLSGYLPGQEHKQSQDVSSNLLSQPITDAELPDLLNPSILGDQGLPHLGQVLPLDGTSLNSAISMLTADTSTDTSTDASAVALAVRGRDHFNKVSGEGALHQASLNPLNSPVLVADEGLSAQSLEEHGFYAQSLVASVMANDSAIAARLSNTPSISTESAKAGYMMPQNLAPNSELKAANSLSNLTASELDAEADRFLGAEPRSSLLKPKSLASTELFTAATTLTPTPVPLVAESTVSLALAMNEDPTSLSLDQLIDAEEIEQGEVETKLTALEKKQDDQTLKLSKGQEAWGNALTERITMNAAQDIKQVTIHLDPPELGSLELKLKINDDQQTQVTVQVQNPQVKEALESSAHRLRDMLASEGLELSEFDVQTDAGRGEQSAQDSNGHGQGKSQDSDASENPAEEISVEIAQPKNNNLLDTFV